MFLKYLILLLLPAVAHSAIKIKIKAAKHHRDASVDFSGTDTAVISDEEKYTFHLTDESLKSASKDVKGEACSDVYLKSPTPYGDVFQKYDWQEVTRIVTPIWANIVNINTKRVVLAASTYTNHNTGPANYAKSLYKSVKEYVNHTWREEGNLTVKRGIDYDVYFGRGSVGGIKSLRYNAPFGSNQTQDRNVTIGTTSSVTVTVPPNETIVEFLFAVEGEMDIEVLYKATVEGYVFCNYHNTYKGHHFYAIPVEYLQRAGNLPGNVYFHERVKVGFYTDAKVVMTNQNGEHPKKTKGGIIKVNS